MKTLKHLFYLLFTYFVILTLSGCKGDDGEAGVDGNANVSNIKLAASDITWTPGSYLGKASNVFTLTNNQVSQDIMNHGIVLGYAHYQTSSLDTWFLLPFDFEQDATHNTEYIKFTFSLNTINLYAFSSADVSSPPSSVVPEYRFILITDETISGGKSAFNDTIINKLKSEGVDLRDYEAVCSYFDVHP